MPMNSAVFGAFGGCGRICAEDLGRSEADDRDQRRAGQDARSTDGVT
jgi:hypothetical protein